MDKSAIDELFFSLYRFYPSKKGKALELLVAAAIKIITGKKVSPDQHVKGEYSNSDYQIDGVLHGDSGNVMIETKDYTVRKEKVGRDDLQTMQGGLTELTFVKGVFASATDFTTPARKYAKATKDNPLHKHIELYHVRPSTEADEHGRIKRIKITITMLIADYDKAQYRPAWTKEAIDEFRQAGLLNREISYVIDSLYNQDGSMFMSLKDFSRNNQPVGSPFGNREAHSCWILAGKAIKINNKYYAIKGIEYQIPFSKNDTTFIVEPEGTPKILIKSDDGSIDKLLTDEELRRITFEE